MDLHFADAKGKRLHDCAICPESQKAIRKCGELGFMNAAKPKYQVDDRGAKYTFCPGKATWDQALVNTFEECLFAYQTGILPKDCHFSEQDELFTLCYPAFVRHYTERRYGRVWQDVNKFTGVVFETIAKMFGGKK